MANSNNIVSAHLVVFINGFVYGRVTGLSWNPQTPRIARRGLDSIMAYELSPGPAIVTGSMNVLRLHGDGGLEGRGIVAPFEHIPEERYFSILVVNRKTGQRVYQADHCMVTGQTWNQEARGRVSGSFNFEGIAWRNEAEYR